MKRKLFVFLYVFFISACQNAHIIMPQAFADSSKTIKKLSLLSTDNKSYSLEELYQAKGAVLIFWQYSCPCVKRYQKRINDLFGRYGQELGFYHISSNTNEDFPEVIAEYQRRNIPVTLLRDQQKALSQALNIKGTPSAALLSKEGELIFLGWIDNERDIGEKKREAYLEDAIVSYLKSEPIRKAYSPMFGCAIR